MTDDSIPERLKKNSNIYIYFLSLYFIAVGTLYLWGYWSLFGVNILEYLTLADIVKSTAYPIASIFISLAVGVVLAEISSVKKKLPPEGGRNTVVGRFLRKHKTLLVILYIAGTLAILVFGPIEKWLLLATLLGTPIAIYARSGNFLAYQIPAEAPRSVCLFLLATLPLFAFGLGKIGANSVLEGKAFYYVIDNDSITPNSEPSQRTRFIGRAGDFVFFWEPKESTISFFKLEAGTSLRLGKFGHSI
ncbi:hypothetical protein [Pseudomonas sp. IzPS59]|uniref:hypothetical protein n=1 Tax=Pseudomonas sp. IzPS59 TaxID=2774459 RepID=UPI00178851C0|nr:hypothetical protein [Pseudomonas sp. IzPS59]